MSLLTFRLESNIHQTACAGNRVAPFAFGGFPAALGLSCVANSPDQQRHTSNHVIQHGLLSLPYVPMPVVRYNEMLFREIWRIPLQLRLMFHLRRFLRLGLTGKAGPPACSAH